MGLFFSSQKEIDHVSEVVHALNDKAHEIDREISLITGDACIFLAGEEKRDSLKKLRDDIEQLRGEVDLCIVERRRVISDMGRLWSTLYDDNHLITAVHRAIVDHLGLEIVVEEPAQSATVKLVKKGKK